MNSVKIFFVGLMAMLLTQVSLADDIIVKFATDTPSKKLNNANTIMAGYRAKLRNVNALSLIQKHSGAVTRYSTQGMSDADIDQLIAQLNANANVLYAERNHRVYLAQIPNDTLYTNQWNLNNATGGIRQEAAWDVSTGNDVVVAVIDTGRLDHSDISGRYTEGYDFYSNTGDDLNGNPLDNDGDPGRDNDPTDPGDGRNTNDCPEPLNNARDSTWHGLRVSSIIAANSNNADGIAGINWNARIMPIRALAKCGGTIADIADSIRWAAGIEDTNLPAPPVVAAKVINLSLGGQAPCSATLQSAIDAAVNAGATIVAAAGNEDLDVSTHTPANCEHVIAVAANNINGDAAYYTNYGETVDITAPGGELFQDDSGTIFGFGVPVLSNSGTRSAATEAFSTSQGTSFSAPHVSGVSSLLHAVRPDITHSQVENILKLTATPFQGGSFCKPSLCGNGILHAEYALRFAESDALFGSSADSVSFRSGQACLIESQATGQLTLRRSGSGIGTLSLSYRTIALSAQAGNDFETIENSIIVWDDGDLSDKTINVIINDDNQTEATEAFDVIITDVSTGASIGSHQKVTVTIQSDDGGSALCDSNIHSGGKFRFVTTKQTVNETAGSVNVTVRRESGSAGAASINYQTFSNTFGAATANEDYTATAGTLQWADGDSADKTITIAITDDDTAEAKENFNVEIFNNTNNTTIQGNNVSVIVIESDEKAGGGASWLITLLMLFILRKRNP